MAAGIWVVTVSNQRVPAKLFMYSCHIQFVPESARFYVVKGKPEKAEEVIKRIAWFNCRDPPKVNSCSHCGTASNILAY